MTTYDTGGRTSLRSIRYVPSLLYVAFLGVISSPRIQKINNQTQLNPTTTQPPPKKIRRLLDTRLKEAASKVFGIETVIHSSIL